MAEINTESGGGKKKGKKKTRAKKMSTRIDFTPMVDLGFLLITFFMLTTTLSKPQTMEINMPVKDKDVDETKVKASTAMTAILGDKDRIFYYFGVGTDEKAPEVLSTNFSKDGLRKILLEKNAPQVEQIKALHVKFENKLITEAEYKKLAGAVKANPDALMVLIKPTDQSKYKNLIDILDEMQICNVGKYAIVPLQPAELKMIKDL